jgi:hypothetical protein
METDLREAMTAGVVVEFRDAQGHTVGQEVYIDWRGRPVPNVGDTVCCNAARRGKRLLGRVCSRQFDVQQHEDGSACVWVLLVVQTLDAASVGPTMRAKKVTFSLN